MKWDIKEISFVVNEEIVKERIKERNQINAEIKILEGNEKHYMRYLLIRKFNQEEILNILKLKEKGINEKRFLKLEIEKDKVKYTSYLDSYEIIETCNIKWNPEEYYDNQILFEIYSALKDKKFEIIDNENNIVFSIRLKNREEISDEKITETLKKKFDFLEYIKNLNLCQLKLPLNQDPLPLDSINDGPKKNPQDLQKLKDEIMKDYEIKKNLHFQEIELKIKELVKENMDSVIELITSKFQLLLELSVQAFNQNNSDYFPNN